MQFQSDPFLGWTTIQGRDFLVRQLNDHKGSVSLDELKSAGLLEYAAVCGETLARGHARAGDPATIAGYLGNSTRFDEAITRFAVDYADQTERDWKALTSSRHTSKPADPPHAKEKPAKHKSVKKKSARTKAAAKSHRAKSHKHATKSAKKKDHR
jgi:hypothetical protein